MLLGKIGLWVPFAPFWALRGGLTRKRKARRQQTFSPFGQRIHSRNKDPKTDKTCINSATSFQNHRREKAMTLGHVCEDSRILTVRILPPPVDCRAGSRASSLFVDRIGSPQPPRPPLRLFLAQPHRAGPPSLSGERSETSIRVAGGRAGEAGVMGNRRWDRGLTFGCHPQSVCVI